MKPPMKRSAPLPPGTVERRAPQPFLYTPDQLLGRAPVRLRRRADKVRFVSHVAAAVALVGLSLWWVIPLHAFAGPVLLTLTPTHGVHLGDLPTLLFGAVALRSLVVARRTFMGPSRSRPTTPAAA